MFSFRLALALGCTVEELLNRISSRELSEWMAYYRIEPFGEERADIRNAILCCITANALSSGGRKHKVDDFIPKFRRTPKEPMSEDAMKQVLQNFCKQFKNKS